MRLYRLETGVLLERDGTFLTLDERWDARSRELGTEAGLDNLGRELARA